MGKSCHISRLAFAVAFVLCTLARAGDVLHTAASRLYRPGDPTRTGIEVEYTGLSPESSARLVTQVLGGRILAVPVEHKTTLREILPDGKKIYNTVQMTEYVVEGSSIGSVTFKPDLNQTSDYGEIDHQKAITELVTEPIRMGEVMRLQKATRLLAESGAKGTTNESAVAIQVNAEIGEGKRENIQARKIVDLLRVYYFPSNREAVLKKLAVPEIRRPYLRDPSPGFMKKLLDPSYNPTERELYDDYIYRQSLEFLKVDGAWTMPIERAQRVLLSMPEPIVPEVVKLTSVRVSSLLMFLFPHDPMSKLYQDSGWAKPLPLIEFREFNTDGLLDVVEPTRSVLGLKAAVEKLGAFEHEQILSALPHVDPDRCVLEELQWRLRGRAND